MNSATKVADICSAAEATLRKLSEVTTLSQLTLALPPRDDDADTSEDAIWADEDIEMLQTAITKFREDLSLISDTVWKRKMVKYRSTLRKRALEDAGISVQPPALPKPGPRTLPRTPLRRPPPRPQPTALPPPSQRDALLEMHKKVRLIQFGERSEKAYSVPGPSVDNREQSRDGASCSGSERVVSTDEEDEP